MQYYVKAIFSGLVAFLGSIGTALLAVEDGGFSDLGAGVYVTALVLGLVAFGGVLGWQAAPPSVSTSVR